MSIKPVEIDTGKGYIVIEKAFSEDEYVKIKNAIETQYKARLDELDTKGWEMELKQHLKTDFAPRVYHKISHRIEHTRAWPKPERVLPKQFHDFFVGTTYFKKLSEKYDNPIITDEERLGYGNIYWRIVRPNQNQDIGALHQDSWFWDIDRSQYVPTYKFKRIKTWISIVTEPGKNGLIVIPDSQKENAEWATVEKHGRIKPILVGEEKYKDRKNLLKTNNNTAVVFHDKLIHGGALNRGTETRVSLEFTCFVNAI